VHVEQIDGNHVKGLIEAKVLAREPYWRLSNPCAIFVKAINALAHFHAPGL
jgi:hypothetical protein